MVRPLRSLEFSHGLKSGRRWGLITLMGALLGCSPKAPAPLVAGTDCHRLALFSHGAEVVGVEDIAYASGRLVLSAYDRLAVESASKNADAPEPPTGGLYLLPVSELGRSKAEVEDIFAQTLGAPGRPHGVDIQPLANGSWRIAVVNRAFGRGAFGAWRARPEIDLLDIGDGEAQLTARILSSRLCSANDIIFSSSARVVATLDRGVCVEDGRSPVGGPALATATIDGAVRTVKAPVHFPNGIARVKGQTWISGTLDRVLSLDDASRKVALPGGPDNLTVDAKGRLVAALHPQIWRFAPYRYGWWPFTQAPSRIVRFDPQRGTLATLFDDADGRTFSGATTGVVTGDKLVLGGVREKGLLVCVLPQEPSP